jgi:hypothetical protein
MCGAPETCGDAKTVRAAAVLGGAESQSLQGTIIPALVCYRREWTAVGDAVAERAATARAASTWVLISIGAAVVAA